jgi:epoxide hydrolase A/B
MKSSIVQAGRIHLHVVEEGSGPAVLLCHGFPETWRSWRQQMTALAAAGYRAIALDMRGYGESSAPESPDEYTQLHIVGDLVNLLDALRLETAQIVGHDWGAVAAWNAALLRPDRFPRIAALSVPYVPRGELNFLKQMRGVADNFYMLQLQSPAADAALAHDVAATLSSSYYAASGNATDADRWNPYAPLRLPGRLSPGKMPGWLDAEDLAAAIRTFASTGFHGALNWYRAMDASFELMAAFKNARVQQPSLFIAGEKDAVIAFSRSFVDDLPRNAPGLVRTVMIPNAGHWIQQEAPGAVNQALLSFLRTE